MNSIEKLLNRAIIFIGKKRDRMPQKSSTLCQKVEDFDF